MAERRREVLGVAFQSPLSFVATITPMADEVIEAVVDAIVAADVGLPGVSGEAASAARFAGHWTERRRSAAIPTQGLRIYEVADVRRPAEVSGSIRRAVDEDLGLLVTWMERFHTDVGETVGDPAAIVARGIADNRFWVWDHGGAVSMAAQTEPVVGTVRVQAVYTPPEHRGRGYAGACVARLSETILQAGSRCILYTDLGNPMSNSVYRRIGYRAVTEVLRYAFA